MPLNPIDHPEQFEIAVLGRAVNEFWDSKIGQYLLRRSWEEYNSALEEFRKVDPTDIKAVTRIQSAMLRAESYRDWLSEAMEDGLRAENIIQTSEFDDSPQE